MITASKNYLTENYTHTIWSQDQNRLINKIKNCIELNDEYQRCFQVTSERLATSSTERPFQFSKMYIFGKFDAFIRRCQKILNLFETINAYLSMYEVKIEGLTPFILKFNMILISIKKKDFDFFDQRKREVDDAIDEFHRSIGELHHGINEFLNKQFDSIRNVERALAVLKRYEKLRIKNLGIEEKYLKILQQFGRELNSVTRIYQKNRNEPTLARNLPPISGNNSLKLFLIFVNNFCFRSNRLGTATLQTNPRANGNFHR